MTCQYCDVPKVNLPRMEEVSQQNGRTPSFVIYMGDGVFAVLVPVELNGDLPEGILYRLEFAREMKR